MRLPGFARARLLGRASSRSDPAMGNSHCADDGVGRVEDGTGARDASSLALEDAQRATAACASSVGEPSSIAPAAHCRRPSRLRVREVHVLERCTPQSLESVTVFSFSHAHSVS